MRRKQLQELGLSNRSIDMAIRALARGIKPDTIISCVENPSIFRNHDILGAFVSSLEAPKKKDKAKLNVWGKELIEQIAFDQINVACEIPVASKAALMPDAHMGYGIPIGGVVALENAISPQMVGSDIACRVKLSLLDLDLSIFERKEYLTNILIENTKFDHEQFNCEKNHEVLDNKLWQEIPVLKRNKDIAYTQLGTSGGGNHFVEFGIANIDGKDFVSILSHSGSRGTGNQVYKKYSNIAKNVLIHSDRKKFGHLAWLDMDSEAGQEYWAAMNLMGEYAHANHEFIHNRISEAVGAKIIKTIENHHNFAWLEDNLYVHRKGATPAQKGQAGIIAGSMGDKSYIVSGKGNIESINSASHGAGRKMGRKVAKSKFSWEEIKELLEKQGITIIGSGADEVPGAYKKIEEVMVAQEELVDILGTFSPKIVRMSGGDYQYDFVEKD